jgi:hypothetical protein
MVGPVAGGGAMSSAAGAVVEAGDERGERVPLELAAVAAGRAGFGASAAASAGRP